MAEDECMDFKMNSKVIRSAEEKLLYMLPGIMDKDLSSIILFGSCARGDYTNDSDIDIALLMNCSREESKKYNNALAQVAAEVAVDDFAVVNFCCIPREEFYEKAGWYAFFQNIQREGKVLYG